MVVEWEEDSKASRAKTLLLRAAKKGPLWPLTAAGRAAAMEETAKIVAGISGCNNDSGSTHGAAEMSSPVTTTLPPPQPLPSLAAVVLQSLPSSGTQQPPPPPSIPGTIGLNWGEGGPANFVSVAASAAAAAAVATMSGWGLVGSSWEREREKVWEERERVRGREREEDREKERERGWGREREVGVGGGRVAWDHLPIQQSEFTAPHPRYIRTHYPGCSPSIPTQDPPQKRISTTPAWLKDWRAVVSASSNVSFSSQLSERDKGAKQGVEELVSGAILRAVAQGRKEEEEREKEKEEEMEKDGVDAKSSHTNAHGDGFADRDSSHRERGDGGMDEELVHKCEESVEFLNPLISPCTTPTPASLTKEVGGEEGGSNFSQELVTLPHPPLGYVYSWDTPCPLLAYGDYDSDEETKNEALGVKRPTPKPLSPMGSHNFLPFAFLLNAGEGTACTPELVELPKNLHRKAAAAAVRKRRMSNSSHSSRQSPLARPIHSSVEMVAERGYRVVDGLPPLPVLEGSGENAGKFMTYAFPLASAPLGSGVRFWMHRGGESPKL